MYEKFTCPFLPFFRLFNDILSDSIFAYGLQWLKLLLLYCCCCCCYCYWLLTRVDFSFAHQMYIRSSVFAKEENAKRDLKGSQFTWMELNPVYPFRYKAATTPSSRENSIFAGDWRQPGGRLETWPTSISWWNNIEKRDSKTFCSKNDLET